MIKQGIISDITIEGIRVIFPTLDDSVTYYLKCAKHINKNDLNVDDVVLVYVNDGDFKNAVIMGAI